MSGPPSGSANTRWRDFADVYTLTRLHPIGAGGFRASLETVAAYRQVQLTPLRPALEPMAERAQLESRAWRMRSHREGELPELFEELLAAVERSADPVLDLSATGGWNPSHEGWE